VELPCGRDGLVEPDRVPLEGAALVSAMLANNETGIVFAALPELAARARKAGVLVHTDAVQAVGKLPVDVKVLGIDLLSFTAHKLGGPKGVGALWIRGGVRVRPLQPGGGQERGRRGGTEDVAEIAGFAAAVKRAVGSREGEARRLSSLRDRLEAGLLRLFPGALVHGASAVRLPGTSSVAFPGIPAETLLVALDLEGVAASAGSACSSGTTKPSRILAAAGVPREEILSTVRFSFGWATTEEDVERLLALLPGVLARVQAAAIS
jgi:cysteine desulfurase